MARNIIITIAITIIIVFSFIIAAPITFLSVGLSSYGKINEFLSYKYAPSLPSSLEKLNLYVAIGNIEILYINPPVDYDAKINVSIEMIGPNLVGKNYSDFFNIVWQNTSGIVNFSMELKVGIDQAEVLSLIKNLNITVALRADVICDISIIVNIQGGVKIKVPWGISVGNILTNILKGDIQYDFTNCIIEGNLTGIIQETGNIELKIYDIEYTQNSTWSLYANKGDILIEIYQHKAMSANITGIIETVIGNYRLFYRDNIANVGAYFILHANQDDFGIHQRLTEIVGFEYSVLVINGTDVYFINSDDYPAQNNYNLLFNLPNGVYYELDLQNT